MINKNLLEKWAPVLDSADATPVKNLEKRSAIAQILENTENFVRSNQSDRMPRLLGEDAATNNISGGNIDTYDPVLISMVRRAAPNLMAYDVMGVQPMSGPTGLIFALRSNYTSQTGTEAFYNEANTAFGTVRSGANTIGEKNVGTTPAVSNNAANGAYNFAGAMTTAQAEGLGTSGNVAFAEMAFSIDKVTVTAQSRAMKAEYTIELAQDLKAVHGLDAEKELANILTTELLAEINREAIRSINVTAKIGASTTTSAGTFDLDVDANGRWSVEKFKGLMFQLEREANAIAKDTRRGKGNLIICSSDVASALQMAGVLDYTPALNSNNLNVDDTGNTFAGVLNGRFKVYIDPYTTGNYATVGYKGASAYDAGLFYCPYVPLQMVRAVNEGSFQPKIGFKTRYGMVANPFSRGATASDGTLVADANVYYRRFLVSNIL